LKIELDDDHNGNGQYLREICELEINEEVNEILVQYLQNDGITFIVKGYRLNLSKDNIQIGDRIKVTYLNTTGNISISDRLFWGGVWKGRVVGIDVLYGKRFIWG
jgi:hypothetical protein